MTKQTEAETAEDLDQMVKGLRIAASAATDYLVARTGDADVAALEIRRAMALPLSVLMRRCEEAERMVMVGGLPDIPQHAAFIVVMLRQARTAEVWEGRETAPGSSAVH